MAEHTCPPWMSFTLTNVFRRMAHDPNKILARFLKEGDTALDVGCGPGFFTIPMAKKVGESGLVIAADINEKMLERVRKRAAKAGVLSRIRLHLSQKDRLGIEQKVDFALAFWTIHEVPDRKRIFSEILHSLKPNGLLLFAEPRIHVTESRFKEMLAAAESAGLKVQAEEAICLSRAVVFRIP